ncbi:ABC transporter substrate-binding protein [Dactylosporangium sp. AC04546]|uniref:ABC transporter substrate-binding protein n=1 Tax=Dactylosporangium sp. AC04546 TaxID=2862460 RepID=UPI001EDFD083|nr:ABC transporter substrate-binding protein [Dactylosporangium sp. AC04546]WVK81039.1 ABC transporter substrate-binding protein [Dactylosporangium sp. AC04546]
MRRHTRALLAGLAVLALALAGCSGGSDSGSTGGSRDATVQLYQAPRGFNPLLASIGPDHLMEQLHWDSLVSAAADNTYGARLAEKWDVSEDGKTWTFHLVKGVKWSDGTPFTARDVVFTYNLYANPKSGSGYAGKFATVNGAAALKSGAATSVAGFQAPDDNTFVIKLDQPNVAFLDELVQPIMFILPEHIVGKFPVEGLTDNPFFRNPTVGLGPYVFSKWVTADQVEFKANPQYRKKLGLDRVFAQYLTTDAAMAQMQTGKLDYAQVAAPDAKRIEGLKGVTVQRAEGPGIFALHTAHDSGKLANPLVRQAIMYAIDRDALVKQVLNGEGTVVDTLVHGPAWAVPSGLTHYGYDPAKAKQLLAQAGWNAGTEVRIELTPGQRDRDTAATIIAAQLKEVGINAKVQNYQAADLSKAIGKRDFDLLISSYGLFTIDPASMNARLSCAAVGGTNISAYCNKQLDELLTKGIATRDQNQRQQIYADAQKIVNEQMPILVMYVPNTIAATSERLKGFKLNPSVVDAFWNAADWSVS